MANCKKNMTTFKENVAACKDKTKDQRIKSEQSKLRKIYKSLPKDKQKVASGLIERAGFMRVELEDLEDFLRENGWTEMFSQGQQEPYARMRPEGQMYNSLNGNYLKIIKQLDSMLPKYEPAPKDDGFDGFVMRRDE